MTFTEAVVAMKTGKKVRREIWTAYCYLLIHFGRIDFASFDDESGKIEIGNYGLMVDDFEAADWEIIE